MRLPPKPRQPDPVEKLLKLPAFASVPLTLVQHVQAVPLGVMVRGTLEWLLDEQTLENLLQQNAPQQYTRELTLNDLVRLLIQVSAGTRASVYAAYQADQALTDPTITTSYQALYGKLGRLHPGLAGALDYAHYRTENHAHGSVQISPLKPSVDPAMNKVRSGTHAYYWWLFPNLMINLYQGVMDTNLVLPLGPDRCRIVFDFYFTDVDGEQARTFNADSIAVAHQVQLEDIGVCEEVQRGLKSRSYDTGRFSVKREAGGYHFHQLLAKALRTET
jgi:hypothetical protein